MNLRLLLENEPQKLENILNLQFDRLDFLKSGYINEIDLQREFDLDIDEMEAVMKEFDPNRTGFIEKETFKLIFKSLINKLY